ncbi:unnamed protein product [Tilletia caries]|nr:unnamed protein product [Tilletia caries]CAD6927067.1 unnamed protein product [Tilletia caries]CAD6974140.1 unnamed protein product [Tilletia controversa]
MKANWKEVKFLASQSGFGWDTDLNLATAADDVWAALIKVRSGENDVFGLSRVLQLGRAPRSSPLAVRRQR